MSKPEDAATQEIVNWAEHKTEYLNAEADLDRAIKAYGESMNRCSRFARQFDPHGHQVMYPDAPITDYVLIYERSGWGGGVTDSIDSATHLMLGMAADYFVGEREW